MQDGRESIALREFWCRLMDNLLQKIQNTHGTSTGTVPCGRVGRIEGEATNGQFHHRQTHTPDIRPDSVGTTLDSLRGHVGRSADKSIRDRINGLCCDTKVAELDVASRIDEDVGRFDITVHDAVGFVEIHQTSQNRLCDLTQHIDPDRAKVFGKAIEGTVSTHERSQNARHMYSILPVDNLPAIHVFHA